MASPKMATFFKFFGVNLKNSLPAMQVPLTTPVKMDVEDAPVMDMEGLFLDGVRKFKKGLEEMTSEYFAAILKRCWRCECVGGG